jgi:hypothetical protein
MATAARISIEQYLNSSYEPDAEFVRGPQLIVVEVLSAEVRHSKLQEKVED